MTGSIQTLPTRFQCASGKLELLAIVRHILQGLIDTQASFIAWQLQDLSWFVAGVNFGVVEHWQPSGLR